MSESPLVPATDTAAIDAARAMLAAPVFEKQLPLALLTKFASDERLPPKERLRAAIALAHLQLKAVELTAHLTGARERALRDQGITEAPSTVHVEQHNTRVEIVRSGASDWRGVVPS